VHSRVKGDAQGMSAAKEKISQLLSERIVPYVNAFEFFDHITIHSFV
jgi:hypothetical protein